MILGIFSQAEVGVVCNQPVGVIKNVISGDSPRLTTLGSNMSLFFLVSLLRLGFQSLGCVDLVLVYNTNFFTRNSFGIGIEATLLDIVGATGFFAIKNVDDIGEGSLIRRVFGSFLPEPIKDSASGTSLYFSIFAKLGGIKIRLIRRSDSNALPCKLDEAKELFSSFTDFTSEDSSNGSALKFVSYGGGLTKVFDSSIAALALGGLIVFVASSFLLKGNFIFGEQKLKFEDEQTTSLTIGKKKFVSHSKSKSI